MHHDTENNKTRLRSFGKTLTGSAVWQLFPAYIFQTLNGINVVCFATVGASAKARGVITHIFGGANSNEGVGLLNFSLDWQYITSAATSLPLKHQANSWVGLAAMYPLFVGLYYANAWGSKRESLPALVCVEAPFLPPRYPRNWPTDALNLSVQRRWNKVQLDSRVRKLNRGQPYRLGRAGFATSNV